MPTWNPYDVPSLTSHWPEVLKACESTSREAAALLFVARPVCVMPGDVVLVYLQTKYAYHQTRMMSSTLRPAIEVAFARVFGKPVGVDVALEPGAVGKPTIGAQPRRPVRSANRGNVRSIPTVYAGVQFRSKLEANTAKLFDDAGLGWQFEVEGYDLDGVWYLPDFWLEDCRTFVEVKGILDSKSEEKMLRLAGVCAPRDIAVVMLRDLRMRPADNYLTVIGDWILPHAIEKDGALLVRCPACNGVSWVRKGVTHCGLCRYNVKRTHQFVRVY